MAGRTHRLDHLEDALANTGLADLVVSPHQFQRLALDERILFLFERCASFTEGLATATRHGPAGQRVGRHLLEEVRHRNIEYLGELEKPARSNAVAAAFIFL